MGLLVTLLIGLVVLAIAIWAVGMIPMDPQARKIVQVALGLVVLLWLVATLAGYAPVIVAG